MEKTKSELGSETSDMAIAPEFQLPDDAPAQIMAFFELWKGRGSGLVPQAEAFDFSELCMEYALLARVGMKSEDQSLFWREVAESRRWPFKAPLANRPIVDSSPTPTETRVLLAFKEALASGLPEYSEITSWMHGGETVSVARLVVPVATQWGRELLALWEVVQPGSD